MARRNQKEHKLNIKTSTLSIIILIIISAVIVLAWSISHFWKAPQKQVLPKQEITDDIELENKTQEISADEKSTTAENQTVSYDIPVSMHGVYLNVGEDFYIDKSSQEKTKQEIDSAIESAKKLDMNAIFINVMSENGTVHKIQSMKSLADFDMYKYIEDKAKENKLYIYPIYDLSFVGDGDKIVKTNNKNTKTINQILVGIKQFAKNYSPSGILFKGYYSTNDSVSFADYVNNGGGNGYKNYERQNSKALFYYATKAMKLISPKTPTGLLADEVWDRKSNNPQGVEANVTVTSLGTGNADTKEFVSKGYADFVVAENFTSIKDTNLPFENVVKWWSGVIDKTQTQLFISHASNKVITKNVGWISPDELTRQALVLKSYNNVCGSVFNSLKSLVDDPGGSTKLLLGFYDNKVKPEHILKELAITQPKKLTYTTYEPVVTFTGASDPNFDVMFNDKKVTTDQNGYFTVEANLVAGNNKFTFSHKGKDVTYNINRKIQILSEISPTGNLSVDGSMSITITADAYKEAKVWAVVAGQKIPMEISQIKENINEQDSDGLTSFKKFTGKFEVPLATNSVQKLGKITVYAQWNGYSEQKDGAFISINKKPKLENGVLIKVVANQAITFPSNTLNNDADPKSFPLPKGTMDYTVGDEMVYKTVRKGKHVEYRYFNLSSGVRVYSSNIAPISSAKNVLGDNVIDGITVTADNRFTDVILSTKQSVPYVVKYNGSSLNITFEYTSTVPSGMNLSKNPLFNCANWKGSTLSLGLKTKNVFMGYRAFYNNSGNLVLRFNNPPDVTSSNLNGARITIDPGHDITDPGALSFNPNFTEQVINWSISQKFVAKLKNLGANVNHIQSNYNKYGLEDRIQSGRDFNSQLFISVHNNAGSSTAQGTEAYYFNQFSQPMASNASYFVSRSLSTNNRGGKFAYFYVTRETQFPAILVECGFISNKVEYNKLKNEDYQEEIAQALTDAVVNFFKSLNVNTGITGTQSNGNTNTIDTGNNYDDNTAQSSKDVSVDEIKFDDNEIELTVGDRYELDYRIYPRDASNKDVSWKSSDEDVATVDSNGKVRAISEGHTKITVTTDDGNEKDICDVYVEESSKKNSYEIKIDGGDFAVDVDEDVSIDVVYSDNGREVKDVSWESSDTSVAKVSSRGIVEGISEGKAKITAEDDDGNRASCIVTVKSGNYSKVKDITIINCPEELSQGESVDLSINIEPQNSEFDSIVWKIDDKSLGTIVSSNGVLTANDNGNKGKITAIVTLTNYDGSKVTKECNIDII